MRASRSTTPKTAKSKQEVNSTEKTSAKKLVQARLPFKIIAPAATKEVAAGSDNKSSVVQETPVKLSGEETNETSSSAAKRITDARKRKLSTDADEVVGEGSGNASRRSSGSKENLILTTKKKKANDDLEEGIVLLNDSDDEQQQQHQLIETTKKAAEKKGASPKTPVGKIKVTPKAKQKQSAGTPQSASKTPVGATKLQIKLPLSGSAKNKRRKLKRKSNSIQKEDTHADESYDEIEIVAEQLNPQKRVKTENDNSKEEDHDNTTKSAEIVDTIDLESDNEDQVSTYTEADKKSKASKESLNIKKKSVTPRKGTIENKTIKQITKSAKKHTKPDTKITTETASANVEEPTVKPVKAKTVDKKSTPVKRAETEIKGQDTALTETLGGIGTKVEQTLKSDNNEKKYSHKTQEEIIKTTNKSEKSNKNINETDTNAIAIFSENESNETTNYGNDDCMSPETSESKVTTINAKATINTPAHSSKDIDKKVLTPKQQKLMEQRRKIREEKERKLQEERLQKQREKEEKEEARKREREEKEEQRRKEREEKEELKRKEREEKELKRLAESEVKNEEKRKKEEERKRKEQEREEIEMKKRREKEEAEQKKRKEIEAFSKFFVPKATRASISAKAKASETNTAAKGEDEETLAFRPFQIKGDMKLAPHCRKVLTLEARRELDTFVGGNTKNDNCDNEHIMLNKSLPQSQLYLGDLRAGKTMSVKWKRPTDDSKNNKDDDVMIVEDELERAAEAIVEEVHGPVEHHRAKFYKFRENRRPPYYGTWRKKTKIITARRPFAQDKKYFDYEIDSDLEWEEEEPGESLDGSDDDKEKESEDDDYEVDNEWFVPHGHLSEEEMQNEDECGLGDDNDREAQKAKLKLLQQEFAQEMKKKTEKIKPRLIGCIWSDENGNQPELCPKIIWVTLNQCGMLCVEPPLMEEPEVPEKSEPGSPSTNGAEKTSDKLKPLLLTEKLQMDLLRLVHGNQHSKNFLINEFIAYVEANEPAIKNGDMRGPLKSTVREKIDEFAEWQITEMNNSKNKKKKAKKRLCWIATPDVLKRMDMENLGLSNKWEYTLQPKYTNVENENKPVTESETINAAEATVTDTGVETDNNTTETKRENKKDKITKYTKVLTTEEKTKQLQKQRKSVEAKEKDSIKQKNINVAKTVQRTNATSTVTNAAVTPTVKKRVPLLMSVARGQQIPSPAKNAVINKFLKTTADAKSKATSAFDEHIVDDDVVILD